MHKQQVPIGAQHYLAQVGTMMPLAPPLDLPDELQAGEMYGSWRVPFSMSSAPLESIFRHFGLWQSSHGLMREGQQLQSIRRGVHYALCAKPVLVGDYLDGQQVLIAQNSYLDRLQLWQVHVIFGKAPAALEPKGCDYRFYEQLAHTSEVIALANFELLAQVVQEWLGMCSVEGKPLVTANIQGLFNSQLEQAKEQVREALAAQGAAQWRF